MSEEKSRIWLSPPHMGGYEKLFTDEAFKENWIAPYGDNVRGFEDDLENYLNTQGDNEKVHVAVVNSGTAALHLGLILLGVGPGDEVLVQSHTHVASANPVMYTGATPVFIDSEPDTFNICPDALESAIKDRLNKGKKLKAIIAVHLYGMPYKADEINYLSQKYGIPVLEDSAEALGSIYGHQKCGTLGEIGVLSFNGNKIITTSGGGAIIVKTKELKEKVHFLASQAKDKAPYYQHSRLGYNYALSNILAGIGRGQMKVLAERVKQRRDVHDFYSAVIAPKTGITLQEQPNEKFFSNFWLNAIIANPVESGCTRDEIRAAFEKENIESRALWKPMHLQPLFKDCDYYGGDVAEKLFTNGLCLPSGSGLTLEEKERIKKVISLL